MLTDPFTGQPIDVGGALHQPGSLTGAMGMDMAESYGALPEDHPVLFNFLENIPGATQMMGYNAWRGSRTIRKGGFAKYGRSVSNNGSIRQGLNNHLNPRSWTRFRDQSIAADTGRYSPFNFLGKWGNKGMNAAVNRYIYGKASKAGSGKGSGALGRFRALGNAGIIGPGWVSGGKNQGYFMGGGFVARASAASTLSRRAGRMNPLGREFNSVHNFLKVADPELAALAARRGLTPNQLPGLTLMSARGTIGQLAGGYLEGAMRPAKMFNLGNSVIPIGDSLDELARDLGRTSWIKGRYSASAALRLGGFTGGKLGIGGTVTGLRTAFRAGGASAAAKFGGAAAARALGYALPGINVVMAAWTATDVLRMGGALMGGAFNLARDAGLSIRGSINKPVMGMGYKDNIVAATSRARGVQAIQASRLNARSVLGAESGMMAAYFG